MIYEIILFRKNSSLPPPAPPFPSDRIRYFLSDKHTRANHNIYTSYTRNETTSRSRFINKRYARQIINTIQICLVFRGLIKPLYDAHVAAVRYDNYLFGSETRARSTCSRRDKLWLLLQQRCSIRDLVSLLDSFFKIPLYIFVM